MRGRLRVFLVLTALFIVVAGVLHHWGWAWAMKAYRPVLVAEVESAFGRQRAGEAEQVLLQALRATPGYRRDIGELARDYLPIMPELANALRAGGEFAGLLSPTPPASNEDDVYGKAVADLALGNRREAREAFAKLVSRGEALPDAAYQLGVCYEEQHDVGKALECYGLAVQSSDAHLDAAQAYVRLSTRE